MRFTFSIAAAGLAIAAPAAAQRATSPAPAPAPTPAPASTAADAPWPEAWFEIFKLAPGKQEEFIRRIALDDQVAAAGGQPPTQLFFHEHGGDWDVILFKPVPAIRPTPAQEAAMAARARELGVPSGPAYFVHIRELVAAHTDSKSQGPLSAAQWLARLDRLRTANGAGRRAP